MRSTKKQTAEGLLRWNAARDACYACSFIREIIRDTLIRPCTSVGTREATEQDKGASIHLHDNNDNKMNNDDLNFTSRRSIIRSRTFPLEESSYRQSSVGQQRFTRENEGSSPSQVGGRITAERTMTSSSFRCTSAVVNCMI